MSDKSVEEGMTDDGTLAATFRRVVDKFSGGIVITDVSKSILYVNDATTKITGYSREELLGKTPAIFQSGQTHPDVHAELREAISKGEAWSGEVINARKDGVIYRESKLIAAIRDDSGKVQYYYAIGENPARREQHEQEIAHLLNFDLLTGLPNRDSFLESLAISMEAANQRRHELGILHVDLDEFSKVVTLLGSENADCVLVEAGKRIKEKLRSVDLIARVGRDDFAILLPGLERNAIEFSKEMAEKILETMQVPFECGEKNASLTASVGIACYILGSNNSGYDLLRNAISATMLAKLEGGNTHYIHEASSLAGNSELRELWQAIERGEMCLHYQPQVNLSSGEIIGLEALIRWVHPIRELVYPGTFIPLIENSHHIVIMGEWVLNEACRQMRAWLDAGLPPVKVAINFAARHFRMPKLASTIAEALQAQKLEPQFLEIEITENVMMQRIPESLETLMQLKQLGVRISLDDFGTGFSSMSYLSRFPIDVVKIDQSFVRDITTNPVNAAIAQATIAMSHKLGVTVLAEGVETEEQMQYLRRNDCDEMQGYFFSRPCEVEEITRMLEKGAQMDFRDRFTDEKRDYVLLVDDETSILSSLRRILRREGYNILTAESAMEGFDLLAKFPVQVIVSDQRMPEMNGIEFLSKVKSMHPKTVRMVLSGYSDISAVTDAINKGAVYRFLNKPWNDELLKGEIRGALRYWRELYAKEPEV